MNLYANYGLTYIPFRLSAIDLPEGRNWLGGSHRRGALPRLIEANTTHLCTLALVEDWDVALFATLDYQSLESPFNFFKGTYKLHDESVPMIQFVVHPTDLPRDDASNLRSNLPLLSLAFSAQGRDPNCESVVALGKSTIFSDHKVGGIPYFEQLEGGVGSSLGLLNEGWVHLIQLVFPSREDAATPGRWPFGESAFHVFAKRESGSLFRFRYCWG